MTSPAPGCYPPGTDHAFGCEASPSLGPSERSDPLKHKKKIPNLELPQGKVESGLNNPFANNPS
eukprot:4616801-Prorocentrum_lima.AAC.1